MASIMPAEDGSHSHTPMRFLPPVSNVRAHAAPEVAQHAAKLRAAVFGMQFPAMCPKQASYTTTHSLRSASAWSSNTRPCNRHTPPSNRTFPKFATTVRWLVITQKECEAEDAKGGGGERLLAEKVTKGGGGVC